MGTIALFVLLVTLTPVVLFGVFTLIVEDYIERGIGK